MQPIELRAVRFKVYHQGMGARVGDVLDVDTEWAGRALAAGIVEAVEPLTVEPVKEEPKAEAKPDI